MPSISSLIRRLRKDFPEFTFVKSDLCMWSPVSRSVHYVADESYENTCRLLHEVAHGILNHSTFNYDSDLIRKEVEAWEYAQKVLGPTYFDTINNDLIDEALETYRIWIHNRSLCPECSQNGMQTQNDTYECLNCRCRWRVNDARQCQLKRYKLCSNSDI